MPSSHSARLKALPQATSTTSARPFGEYVHKQSEGVKEREVSACGVLSTTRYIVSIRWRRRAMNDYNENKID